MKQTSLLILFAILISQLNSQNIYTKEEIFNFLNGIDVSEETLTSLKNVLADTFKNAYAFNEIAKNPPQPDFDNAYYKPVDIQERMKNVNTKNTNFYTVFQELRKIIAELGDGHIDLNIANLGEIKYSYPITFSFRKVNDKPKVFAFTKEMFLGELINKFEELPTIFPIIVKNLDTPIESINGEDPFEYILNFGKEYFKAKSPHTTAGFHHIHSIVDGYNFKDYPFSKDDLTSLKIVYENKEEFTTNYLYYSSLDLNSLELKKEIENKIKLFVNQRENLGEKKIEFIKENLYDNPIKNPMKNFNLNQNNDITPDYNFNNYFQCRVDHNHKLNLYAVMSFDISGDPKYHETIINCTELFDTNNYPIAVFLLLNTGGSVDNALVLSQLVSPKIAINYYTAFRKTEIIKDTTFFNYYLKAIEYRDYDNCEVVNYSTLIKKEKEIDYGNGVKESIFGPLILSSKNHTKELNEIKKNLKNKRNPTDIIIFTDGFSFSAASMFTKYLQYYGGAITVGYSLNPKLENITFDSGNSPTPIFMKELVYAFNITGFEEELYKEIQLTLQLSGIQTFYDPYNLSHPLEYEVTPVDEMVNYYYDLMQPDYDELAEHALNILEKYKTNCNPKNKKLLLLTDKCDGKFKNSYTHGGYVCGEDGKWTETCVASYCDIGYIFDHVKKECTIDACSDRIEPPNTKKNYFKTVILIVVPIIIILILIIILIILIRRKRRNNNEVESIDKTNLTEGLNV